MPAMVRQLNVRVDEDTQGRLARLVEVVSAAKQVPLSQSDLIRLALIEMEERYAKNAARRPVPKPHQNGAP